MSHNSYKEDAIFASYILHIANDTNNSISINSPNPYAAHWQLFLAISMLHLLTYWLFVFCFGTVNFATAVK
jgi:hypothetical protein